MEPWSAAVQAQAGPRNARRDMGLTIPFISELILHAQLDHSIAAATEDFARVRIRQAPITSVRNRSRRRAEIEMAERVHKIGAKLYSMPLSDGYCLLHSNNPVPGA